MSSDIKVVVTSPSFSRSEVLRQALLAEFPNARFNEQDSVSSGQSLIDFVADADALVLGLHQVTETLLESCPNLKIISKYGVGLDNVPRPLCEKYGVKIGWTGGVNKHAVAEQALALMISLTRNLFTGSMHQKSGRWVKQGGRQLNELTIGIVGFGFVGQELARLLKPFGCKILVHDIKDHGSLYQLSGVESVSRQVLFAEADVISLHVDLNEDSFHMINAESIATMKCGSYIVNTARGPVVEQEALKHALIEGQIAGAALDVYEQEPPTDKEFLNLSNLICTPHIAGNSKASVEAMGQSAIQHLVAYFKGQESDKALAVSSIEGAA